LAEFGPGCFSKLLFQHNEVRETRPLLGVMSNIVGFIFRIIMV